MADFALVALCDTFHASLGCCLDAYALVRDRIEQLFSTQDTMRMQTQLRLLTEDGRDVRLADGRRMQADATVGGGPYDLVHIAAFRVGGVEALDERLRTASGLFAWLHRLHGAGTLISASGAAVLVLAEAGFLDGIAAPLPRALIPLCRARFPRLRIDEHQTLVEKNGLILGAGLAAEAAQMVRLIERTISAEMARWLASVMGADRITHGVLAPDALVGNAQLWLEQRFTENIRITDLALAMATNQQTLARHFHRALQMTPKHYVQHLRVLAAQRMLRQTRRSIEQIASHLGYRDARSFRSAFRAHVGVSATAYRARQAPEA